MLGLIFAAAVSSPQPSADRAVALCKPVLARKAGGEIPTMSVQSSRSDRSGKRIRGQLTAFLGMGSPAPGMAAAHHLIRADFTFRCTVRNGRVREAAVNPLQP